LETEDHDGGDAYCDARQGRVGDASNDLGHVGEPPIGVDGHVEDLLDLGGEDLDGETGQEPDEDGLRDEPHHRPGPEKPQHDEDESGEHRDTEGQLLGELAGLDGEHRDETGEQRSDGRVRTRTQLAGTREQRERDDRHDRRIDPDDDREPGRLRVADVQGQRECGKGDAREDLGDHPRPPAGQQHPADSREVGAT
jgi:hypothetical protein